MPSQKISAMPFAGPLVGTEVAPIVQAGVNKKCQMREIAAAGNVAGMAYVASGQLRTSPGINPDINSNLAMPGKLLTVGTVQADNVYVGNISADQVAFRGAGGLAGDANITAYAGGYFFVKYLSVAESIECAAGAFAVDNAGRVDGSSLHAQNGFTGSGAFTNFTIQDGIITAAS